MPNNDELYGIIGGDYDPNFYDAKPTNPPQDPTLKALQDNEVKNFLSYPEDLTQIENPGHFILIQAFEVEGITLEDVISGVKNITTEAAEQAAPVVNGYQNVGGITIPNVSFPNIASGAETTYNSALGNGVLASDEAALADQDERNKLAERLYDQTSANTLSGIGVDYAEKDVLGKRKILRDTIALYMPENLSTSYSFDYASENTLFSSGVRAVIDWMNTPNRENFRQSVRDLKNFAIETGLNLGKGSMNLFGQDISGQISGITRKVLNPHLEMLFRQVNMRSFTYTFNFFARNEREVEEVDEIIKKFKFHAHPVYDSKSTFLTMPSEFEIIFYSANKENTYMNRVLPCVLTGIDVNYTPNGQAAFFADVGDKGQAPTQIQLSLTFTESGLLHRDHIEAGY